MKFLVTNDDGVLSSGLSAVVEVLQRYGQVHVVCPDQQRSAASHSITLKKSLQVKKTKLFGDNVPAWTVNGTPADCVKLALDVLIPTEIDLVISGINIGANIGHDYYYSGTISGAMEAFIQGISAIAVSLDISDGCIVDFSFSKKALSQIIEAIGDRVNRTPFLYNINIPNIKEEECKGLKTAPLDFSLKRYCYIEESVLEEEKSYMLVDHRAKLSSEYPDHDFALLNDGYITVTPLNGPKEDLVATEIERLLNKHTLEGSL